MTYLISGTSNLVTETILMTTHNIGFIEEMAKIIFQLSSNTHFIFSSVNPTDLRVFQTYLPYK